MRASCLQLAGLAVLWTMLSALQGESTAKTEIISADFSVYLWPTGDMSANRAPLTEKEKQLQLLPSYQAPEFCYEGSNGVKRISVYHARQTPFYSYSGPPQLQFFREKATEKGTIRVPQGQADIPTGWKRVLLLGVASQAPGDTESFRFYPVNLNDETAPDGYGRLFNLSKRSIYARIGNQDLVIPPYTMANVKMPDANDYLLRFRLAIDEQGSKRIIYSANRTVLPDQSPLFIIFAPNPERADLRMLTLHSS